MLLRLPAAYSLLMGRYEPILWLAIKIGGHMKELICFSRYKLGRLVFGLQFQL